jgi:hypothetical protein
MSYGGTTSDVAIRPPEERADRPSTEEPIICYDGTRHAPISMHVAHHAQCYRRASLQQSSPTHTPLALLSLRRAPWDAALHDAIIDLSASPSRSAAQRHDDPTDARHAARRAPRYDADACFCAQRLMMRARYAAYTVITVC